MAKFTFTEVLQMRQLLGTVTREQHAVIGQRSLLPRYKVVPSLMGLGRLWVLLVQGMGQQLSLGMAQATGWPTVFGHKVTGDRGVAAKFGNARLDQVVGNALAGSRPKCGGLVNRLLRFHAGQRQLKHGG